jgi:hypothetical protein
MQLEGLPHCKDKCKFTCALFNQIQSGGRKREVKITKYSFHTLDLVFYGWFKLIVNKEARYKPMWFCLDDKDQHVYWAMFIM